MYILFTEKPEDIRFIKDTYTNLPADRAQGFIDSGVAVEYNPKTGEKLNKDSDEVDVEFEEQE